MNDTPDTERIFDLLSKATSILDGIGRNLEPGIETVTILVIGSLVIVFAVGLVSRVLGKMISRLLVSIVGTAAVISSIYIASSNGTLDALLSSLGSLIGS